MKGNFIDTFWAIKAKGGASFNLETGELNPPVGYMVAIPNFELIVSIPDNLNKFLDILHHYLTKEVIDKIYNENLYLGFWEHEGNLYIDLAEHVGNINEALELGRLNKQKAIYDIVGEKDIFITSKVSNDPDIDTDKRH